MEIIFTLDQIQEVAQTIIDQKGSKIVLLNGEMGAGKTTLIKNIVRALGVIEATSSPTFSLVNEYQSTSGEVLYHFDVYRIKDESEAVAIGIEDYLYSGNWCFIEWSEKIPNLIPEHHIVIELSVLEDGKRKFIIN